MKPGTASTLQLRILSGMHAGACATLDGDEYTLGTLSDCDFVLSDAGVQPHHARLSRTDEGWQLDWIAQEGEEPRLAPTRLEHGKAVPLGPIVVSVDDEQAAWPTLEQLVLVPHAAAFEPDLPPPVQPPPTERRGLRALLRGVVARSAVAWTATLATGGLSALALVAWPTGTQRAAHHPKPAESMQVRAVAPDPAQKRAIEEALDRLGMSGRVKIEPSGAAWTVRASLLSDVEGEALAAALSKIQPLPGLRMTTEQELRDDVTDMLLRIAPEYRGNVSLRYLGDGRFRLEGHMFNASERDKLLHALATAFPEVRDWDNAILSREDMGDQLLAELRSRGDWQIATVWDNGTLQMDVSLSKRDVQRWEQALVTTAATRDIPFNATLNLLNPVAPRHAVRARLPFEIRGVIGGDVPYVLLPNGEKLAQGGTVNGWRLASIGSNELIFENGALRATLPR